MAGVGRFRFPWLPVAWTLAASCALSACGGGAGGPTPSISGPAELGGKIIGVSSLGATSTLEVRYLLHEAYGLDEGRDIALLEAPAESLPLLLREGGVDAVVLSDLAAYRLAEEGEFAVLRDVSSEVVGLSGGPVVGSVLITYPDVVAQKDGALAELNRMFEESVTYFRANEDQVIDSVAREHGADAGFLSWWWDRQELALGQLSAGRQERLQALWEAARTLGDIDEAPAVAGVVFGPGQLEVATSAALTLGANGDRVTISLAVLDHPARRAALYAIERGLVTSDSVDVSLSYLPESVLMEAPAARHYDVVEATPLIVPLGAARSLDFVVLSAGVVNHHGTLLFVRSERR